MSRSGAATPGTLSLEELAHAGGESPERLRDWQRAGLLGEPGRTRFVPADVDRVALLGLLERRGVPRATVLARRGEIDQYVAHMGRRPREWTGGLAEAAARVGLAADLAERAWVAAGLRPNDLLDEHDVGLIEDVRTLRDVGFPDDAVIEIMRVVGDAIRRAVEAQARIAHFHVFTPLEARVRPGEAFAAAMWEIGARLMPLSARIAAFLDARLLAVAGRENIAMRFLGATGGEPDALRLAIVFVDVCSFTPLAEAMGDRESADVLARFSTLVREAVARHDGRVVKQIGDAFLLTFATARAAVACALDVETRTVAEPRFPAVRSGIHWGTVLYRDGDYVGANVNVAARIAGEAGRHEVVVTEAVRAEVSAMDGVAFVPLGPRRLKGVSEPVELFVAGALDAIAGERRVIDPVCGMELGPSETAARLALPDAELAFCSTRCLQRYVADAARYR